MKASKAILELLKSYSVTHVFGLVGETSFPLYEYWSDYEKDVSHVFARDERNAVIMADAYARFSFKPGIVEVPGVGAPYTLPGLVEANISSIPIIMIVSDIPSYNEKRNVLTEHEKEYLAYNVKDFININDSSSLPRLLRRAFRLATTGRTGPVVVRVPMNVYEGEVSEDEIYAQTEYSRYPSHRFAPDEDRIAEALKILLNAERPVIICGQGVLLSQAWEEVIKLAETLYIPVGTTITGKGSFPENHPLSLGVIGARGGTKFSNSVVQEADVVFLIGTNTDSANTWDWRIPSKKSIIIQLDVSEHELGNNYKVYPLLGDAKLTLKKMINMISAVKKRDLSTFIEKKKEFEDYINSLAEERMNLVNPIKFVKYLSRFMDNNTYIISDPGTGAIYSSAYLKLNSAGRRIMYNYSLGGLGYAIPASIGAYIATKGRIVALTSDGNLYFNMGELETINRLNVNVKIFLFNNKSFGWIRASMLAKYGRVLQGTDISEVKYADIASAFNLDYMRIENSDNIEEVMNNIFKDERPKLIEVLVESEEKLLPPVPDWENIRGVK